MNCKKITDGIKVSIPVCLGVIPVGISFGLLAVQTGLSQFQTILMSALVMAGSSQFMVVGMIGQATFFSMIMATFFVNLRHIVMSSSVMSSLKKTTMRTKLICAFALCDESFALFSLSESNSAAYLLGANTALYSTWVLSTLVGCMLGQFLPEVITKGFGIAFYAAFLSMLVPNTVKHKGILYLVILAAVLNTILQIILPSSWAVIIAMIVSAALGVFFVEEQNHENT